MYMYMSYTFMYMYHHFTTSSGAGERTRGYALLMTANNPETALYRAATFSLLLVSHGGISSWTHLLESACNIL